MELLVIGAVFLGLVCVAGLIYERSRYEYQEDDEKTEEAKVIDVTFTPYSSSTSVTPTFVGGKVGFGVSTHSTPEHHLVVLRSKSFKKIVLDDEDFFGEVEVGDKVKVRFAEVYKVRKDNSREREFYGIEIKALMLGKKEVTEFGLEDYDYKTKDS